MRPKSSKYIQLTPGKCAACWECVYACPNQALGKVVVLWHKHSVFRNPENCSGCCKCIQLCKHGALTVIKS